MDTILENINRKEIPSVDELRQLMENASKPCVSIYMPLHEPGTNVLQDAIALGNLLRQARELLVERGLGTSVAQGLLKPAHEILEEDHFWQHPGDGLAIFVSPNASHYYWPPLQPAQMVMVGNHFYIRPLLPLLTGRDLFYILALSLNEVRLLRCTPYGSRVVSLPKDVPGSLADALKYDEFEQQHQLFTGTPGWGSGKPGRPGAVFYGQGVGSDIEKDNILRYFQKIDKGLHPLLRQATAPLMLAGVEYLLPLYREANNYPHLAEGGIVGSPDRKNAEELRNEAGVIVHPLFEKAQQEAIDRYTLFVGSGQTITNIQEIVPAAYYGQVDTLFLASSSHQWGLFEPSINLIERHEEPRQGDEDLLNLAASHTLLNHGTVYALEPEQMPDKTTSAAMLRYQSETALRGV